MNVLLLTVFISVLLAGLFVILFLEDHRLRRLRSIESVSLLPLEDDAPHQPSTQAADLHSSSQDHGHSHHGSKPHPCPNNGKCCGDCKKRKPAPAKAD